MKQKRSIAFVAAMAAVLVVTPCLSGCGLVTRLTRGKPTAASANPSATVQPGAVASPSAGQAGSAMDEFAAAFKAVEQNPLHETIQYVLWLAAGDPANAPGTVAPASGAAAVLKELKGRFDALVDGPGVHYREAWEVMGMKSTTETWWKAGKFKVVTEMFGTVSGVIYDGQHYIKYDADDKTGQRFTKETAALDITTQLNGRVPESTFTAYTPKEDETVGGYDCSVFFFEMGSTGMTGNTIYVDKQTGILMRYVVDGDMPMDITVTSFETGGFGDEVFAVPAGVTLEDYQQ